MFDRKDYLAGRVSHAEYYAQFVTQPLKAYVARAIGRDKISASTDPHLNDIPLARWDGLTQTKHLIDRAKFKAADNVTYAEESRDKFEWSLGDQVCIAKAAASAIKMEG